MCVRNCFTALAIVPCCPSSHPSIRMQLPVEKTLPFRSTKEYTDARERWNFQRCRHPAAGAKTITDCWGYLPLCMSLCTFGTHYVKRRVQSKTGRLCQGKQLGRKLPRCVVFDLDGCLWYPEMYELSWDRGGAPFSRDDAGNIRDRRGCVVRLHDGVDAALTELAMEAEWRGVVVAVASCCDVPPWAFELLGKFEFGPSRRKLASIIEVRKIHKGSKQSHFREISSETGCDFDEMIFFDNEKYNCDEVAQLGLVLSYRLDGEGHLVL